MMKMKIMLMAALSMALQPGAQPATLRAAAEKVNLNFGVALGSQVNKGDQATMNLVKDQFNILVNENSMKFGSVEPTRGNFNFSSPEVVVKFAEDNGIKMRGHNIVWHNQSGFATTLNSGRADMLKVLKAHIDSTLGHFKGRILEWDIINEAVEGAGLRQTFWKANIGDDYLDSAFVWAHKADPSARLYYNDYGAEGINTKSNTIYNMVKSWKEKGIPIDGVGLQCHLGNSVNKADISANIKRLGDLGLRVSLTEIDLSGSGSNTTAWNNLMGACLENANCVSFLTWGVDDAHSWRGSGCDCLLFNSSLQPKPIVAALIATMNAANPTIAAARKAFASGGQTRVSKTLAHTNSNLSLIPKGFKYNLHTEAQVRLDVFNVLGNKMATLVNTRQTMGMHSLAWDKSRVSPGHYFIQLQIDGDQEITKMLVSP